jgi:hypothetical protein
MKYPNIEIQETSLVAHIRNVIDKFIRTGRLNKGKPIGIPSIYEKVVKDLRQR